MNFQSSIPVAVFLLVGSIVLGGTCAWTSPSTVSRIRHSTQLFLSDNKNKSPPYPRAAVSVAVRCDYKEDAFYLLVQRGNEPNKGKWSFPGGKLELGETALAGGQRELQEETRFKEQSDLQWFPEPITTADSILDNQDGSTAVHFLIAVCFACLGNVENLPKVIAMDDAADAKWWSIQDLLQSGASITPGLMERMRRTEVLHQSGVLL
jgi:8-oxo-dGTP diphosphatase